MAMKLFDRMTTLIKADAHGVVDALEERSLLLRQHVREAELELLQKRARVEALTERRRGFATSSPGAARESGHWTRTSPWPWTGRRRTWRASRSAE